MERADVIILGGGLVGLTLAIALDAHGLTSIVVDPADPAAMLAKGFDGRASAVSSSSHQMLDAIGVGAHLAGQGCPIGSIRVSDGLTPSALVFDPGSESDPLGVMYENRLLRQALYATAEAAAGITLLMKARPADVERDSVGVRVTLADGRMLAGSLLIGAEGRNSPTREAAGINVARWSYRHAATIATLGHERPHGNVAHEIFYPTGPFALLPMTDDAEGHRSAIVWTMEERDGPAMMALPDRAFLAEAEKRMGGMLGKLRSASPRSSYPLGFHHTARITETRLALVGDAAHGIHPIAGQGLNLGFRDVAALTEVLVDGARLGLPGKAPLAVRRFGLGMVSRIAPLKRRFMAEARGETGKLPKLLSGMSV
jgi:2-octaprenyl-6-methoxyphenol hydroxylase